jgi:hypothetical protein
MASADESFPHTNLREKIIFDPDYWCDYLRVDEEAYLFLSVVSSFTDKSYICTKMTATLTFLAAGGSYEDHLNSPQSWNKFTTITQFIQ